MLLSTNVLLRWTFKSLDGSASYSIGFPCEEVKMEEANAREKEENGDKEEGGGGNC